MQLDFESTGLMGAMPLRMQERARNQVCCFFFSYDSCQWVVWCLSDGMKVKPCELAVQFDRECNVFECGAGGQM